MDLTPIKIGAATESDMEGYKVLESDSHIGLFNFNVRRFFRAFVVSKHLFRRTRLIRVGMRRFRVDLYNYPSSVSFHKSKLIYGMHILLLRLIWNRF